MKNHTILKNERGNKWNRKIERRSQNNKDELWDCLLDAKILTDLEYEKHDTLNNIAILASKLIKLGTTPIQIDKIKKSVLSS